MGGKVWVSKQQEINVGDLLFLEDLGVKAIINKVDMNFIWAQLKSTNVTLKLNREVA